ncbi:Cytochrome P450, conserved site,Cytochrome P450,Cytochrome P450, E-class, group I [Cinara cedri]|uniref:Cytochrome P450, conserved site,Cytochrome P450,Cytochrome P450, E-class, group I n=1 Tax=Cinara cedri TaxID=506608 RepID=A0A5E4N8H7_9HEMI|nr:Cytochrome P450, conserved site,Cytochrome P450,Cytochrome P450, E-class, group I [Cinara cedri]
MFRFVYGIFAKVPSITKTFWSRLKFAWTIGKKNPTEMLMFYTELVKNNGSIFHFNLAGRPYVILNDPDDLKILLSSSNHINKGPEYELLQPWLNDGLLLSSGSKWHSRRKLLTKAFHFKSLHYYNKSMNRHSRILIKKLLEESTNNNGIYITEYITLCALDIVFETIMGAEINAQENKSNLYIQCIKQACRSTIDRMFTFWLWNYLVYRISATGRKFIKAVKVLHNYTDEIIIKKKEMFKNNKENEKLEIEGKTLNKSFLDLLLEVLSNNPGQMTDKDIREELDTFLFEGHDTSSISLTMTIILLGMYPDIQDKVRNELLGIFGDSDRDASIQDLNSMQYLDAVIKESLRIYPSVPYITRKLETSLTLKNYTIPQNTVLGIFPYILHKNEKIFTNPEEFIPERFLDESNKEAFLFGYLPFSAGPRNCIGQKYVMYQMKTILSTILRKSKIETLAKREDIQISMELILRLNSPIKMQFYAI